MLYRVRKVKSDSFTTPLKPCDAESNRDALSKALYDNLFEWLVQRLNQSIIPEKNNSNKDPLSIGLLDIFGFENFKNNSFE